ncbi:MAG: DNA-packaging protein [Chloroflexi bacterium]|nr:DNA-packaging protein [Chloroflexota bacterium]
MQTEFKKTPKQIDALSLLADPTKTNILLSGGSRSGKTFILVYTMIVRALKAPGSCHLMLRLRFNHAINSLVHQTIPKVFELAFPGLDYKLSKTRWFYKLPNGSEIWIGGLDDGERVEKILGTEFSSIYFNECSQLDWEAIEVVKTRLASKNPALVNKLYFDCNPPNKRHWTYKVWIQNVHPVDNTPIKFQESYGYLKMNPEDNRENLADNYIESTLMSLSERDRKRFKDGEFTDDAEGALFKWGDICKYRVKAAPEMRRVVVGIDPAVTANNGSNNTGIVAAGVAKVNGEDHYYILDDATLNGTPAMWARAAIDCYEKQDANEIIAEINQGGDLVEANLRTIMPLVPYKPVRATRGKAIRAEPVATACEKGRLHFVGEFTELENELTSWAPASGEPSPDRLDAMVWAVRGLMNKTGHIGVWR